MRLNVIDKLYILYLYMCFSFEISLGTFLLSWSISLYLLTKKLTTIQKQNVIFLMIISSIQALDAILWYNKMKKNTINYIVTSFFIPFVLCAQIYYNLLVKNKFNNLLTIVILFVLTIYTFIKFNGYSVALCNNKLSSPIWGNNEIGIYEFIVFAVLGFYPKWIYMFASIFILLPILYFYVGGAYGSLWCAVANFIAIKYLIFGVDATH